MLKVTRYYLVRCGYFMGKRLVVRSEMSKHEAYELYRVLYDSMDTVLEYMVVNPVDN